MDRYRLWERSIENAQTGCREWRGANVRGYGQIRIRGKTVLAHRLAWQVTFGPIPEGLLVCHRCDNRSCVNPQHLFLGDAKANTQDMIAKGRDRRPDRPMRGEGHYAAKLNEEQVLSIRADNGKSQQELATMYGVTKSVISHIKTGRSWKHLPRQRTDGETT